MNIKTNSITFLVLLIFTGLSINAQEKSKKQNTIYNLSEYLTNQGYVKLEMKKLASGHLHLSGLLNGVQGNFILDTGATGTVVDIKMKDKFNMQTKLSDREAAGAGGSNMQMEASSKNNLTIGKLDLKSINLMLMSLDHVNKAFERFGLKKVDGVIGADILTSNKAIIDYVDLSLYLKV